MNWVYFVSDSSLFEPVCEKDEEIQALKSQLVAKEIECKTWMTKIEQANELADEFETKMSEIKDLNDNLEHEKQKRKHLETMFQDLNEQLSKRSSAEETRNRAASQEIESEKQALQNQLSIESQKYQQKLEENQSKIKDLENSILQFKAEIQKSQAEKSLLLEKDDIKNQQLGKLNLKLEEKIKAYEDLSQKHANLLISKKDMELQLNANINSIEVSNELSVMRSELKKLHEILAEKEKELVFVKLQETTSNDKMELMKSEVLHKEVRIHEVELKLDMEKRKINAFQDHIKHLKSQLNELQMQAQSAVNEKTATFQKIRDNLSKEDDVNNQWIKELKSQLKSEQDKLKQVPRIFFHYPRFLSSGSAADCKQD